jgi:hypothetical protein
MALPLAIRKAFFAQTQTSVNLTRKASPRHPVFCDAENATAPQIELQIRHSCCCEKAFHHDRYSMKYDYDLLY